MDDLSVVKNFEIPRCLFEFDFAPLCVELHTFCDASEKAYAAIAYSRAIYKDGRINIRIIASKSYVAPLKPMSIPRLELQAAVVGARLADTIVKEAKIKFARKTFWSDSRTVLCWIRSDPKMHQMFVANRLGELDELTEVGSWRWVSGDENPADVATKEKKLDLSRNGLWQSGPKFLSQNEKGWPQQPPITRKEFEEKSRLEAKSTVMAIHHRASGLPDPLRFSKWTRLLRSTARVLVAIDNFRGWKRTEVEVDDLKDAEMSWIREIQASAYPREIEALSINQPLPSDSPIAKLTPVLSNEGILRAQGRTSRVENVSNFSFDPIILDGSHPVARLLIGHYHVLFNHANTETVVNELRQRYWITRIRVALRSIAAHCALCQLRRSKPSIPRMSDLPSARLAHGMNPFSHCGLDYFGPLTVTIGRRHEKR